MITSAHNLYTSNGKTSAFKLKYYNIITCYNTSIHHVAIVKLTNQSSSKMLVPTLPHHVLILKLNQTRPSNTKSSNLKSDRQQDIPRNSYLHRLHFECNHNNPLKL